MNPGDADEAQTLASFRRMRECIHSITTLEPRLVRDLGIAHQRAMGAAMGLQMDDPEYAYHRDAYEACLSVARLLTAAANYHLRLHGVWAHALPPLAEKVLRDCEAADDAEARALMRFLRRREARGGAAGGSQASD